MKPNTLCAAQWRILSSWFAAIVLIAAAAVAVTPARAQAIGTAVPLGTASTFAVLGGQSVTNTGPSVVTGDLGVSPGTSITGFPPGIVNGAVHPTDAVALQAQTDLTTAYNNAAGQAPDSSIAGDLGGLTLVPGVYNASSSIGLTGTLTLDAQGDPNAVWIFQVGSTLTTASASQVLLINGASPCNVFWQIGSSATLGTNSNFVGNILALTSITLNTGATVNGRALARNGSVTMDTNVISRSACGTVTTGGTTSATTTGTTGATTTTGTTTGVTTGTTTGVIGGITSGGIITGGTTTAGTTGATTTAGTTGGTTTAGTTGGTTTGGSTGATTTGGTATGGTTGATTTGGTATGGTTGSTTTGGTTGGGRPPHGRCDHGKKHGKHHGKKHGKHHGKHHGKKHEKKHGKDHGNKGGYGKDDGYGGDYRAMQATFVPCKAGY
ncbi:ice-binding family protein [Streptomyces sp. NPDC058280]|uniref:ice-binding family protein n=1 Tax=Streptomyces sp. NPDC058280 TaxID=3346419 RepID=UPI0036EA41C4